MGKVSVYLYAGGNDPRKREKMIIQDKETMLQDVFE